MKMFITDVYKIFLKLTGNRCPSIILAVAYTSALNLLIVYCLGFLLKGISDGIILLLKLFTFPYLLVPLAVMLAFNSWLLMPFHYLTHGKRKPRTVAPMIVYSLVALVLFLYGRYFERLF